MTDNQRLARVLRLLADVAGKFPVSMPPRVMDEIVEAIIGLDALDLDKAEKDATEAARLAGVPVDEWRQVADVPIDEFVLVTVSDPDIDGGKPYVAEAILCEAQDEGTHEWCMRPDYEGDGPHLLGGEVLAWRPLPAPYRPEETTDEQV